MLGAQKILRICYIPSAGWLNEKCLNAERCVYVSSRRDLSTATVFVAYVALVFLERRLGNSVQERVSTCVLRGRPPLTWLVTQTRPAKPAVAGRMFHTHDRSGSFRWSVLSVPFRANRSLIYTICMGHESFRRVRAVRYA